ncbi:GlcG/HbpS family heme-binding protein [Bdellovibrio reynosensis]|uniref:Heme-binding protein n=1 Tax=Bdellovibrio reynosensis TaxID=2835041 RepID=A0ABY4C914_9BACT|nr:heme-binding protein [Bdellovibrio reynosensis]UOF01477.1 heme-binding protein [Bdellovibrio reynosensis]
MKKSITLLVSSLFACSAQAITTTETNITMAGALIAAQAAVENCASKGYSVAATVVDASGDTKVTLRADGAGPHTLDASRRKAYTSASARQPTSAMLATSQTNPTAQNLGQIDGFLLLGGGIPIRINNVVVGAIGVGGAPGGPLDDQCAQAGIDKLLAK